MMYITIMQPPTITYPVIIGTNIESRMVWELKKRYKGRTLFVVTDSNVKRLWVARLAKKLGAVVLSFSAGEQCKNLKTFAALADQLVATGADRKSVIVAVGGGVVGDMAGLLAASYMRGIGVVQVPTTILAQTTSAIGGKTGLDIPDGKNYLGAFKQPEAVYMDTRYLITLPEREVRTGLSEVIGYGVFADAALFSYIEKNLDALLRVRQKEILCVVCRCVAIKKRVIEKDEKDLGMRHVLNYGHTVGHAIEQITNYKKYTHGEAIAIGACVAARMSQLLGYIEDAVVERHDALYRAVGLPTRVPRSIATSKIMRVIQKDKKIDAGKVPFILIKKIGTVVDSVGIAVKASVVSEAIGKTR